MLKNKRKEERKGPQMVAETFLSPAGQLHTEPRLGLVSLWLRQGLHESKLGRPQRAQKLSHDTTALVFQAAKLCSNRVFKNISVMEMTLEVAEKARLRLKCVASANILSIVLTAPVFSTKDRLNTSAPSNMLASEFSRVAFLSSTVLSKLSAPLNMLAADAKRSAWNSSGWLKCVAFSNMLAILCTLRVSRVTGASKLVAS